MVVVRAPPRRPRRRAQQRGRVRCPHEELRPSALLLRGGHAMTATRRRLGPLDAAVALALSLGYLALLLKTAATLGYARDEGFYFQAASSYARWFEQLGRGVSAALERKAIDAAW